MTALLPLSILTAGPVSLDAMRTYLRVDGKDDDDTIASVLASAREMVERRCGRLLCPQIWRMRLDAWPDGGQITIPLLPFRRVVAIRVYDVTGAVVNVPLANLSVSATSEPGILKIADPPVPGVQQGGIELDIEAGYVAPAEVPAALTLAVMRMAARLYEQRGDEDTPQHDAALDALIAPYKTMRLA